MKINEWNTINHSSSDAEQTEIETPDACASTTWVLWTTVIALCIISGHKNKRKHYKDQKRKKKNKDLH